MKYRPPKSKCACGRDLRPGQRDCRASDERLEKDWIGLAIDEMNLGLPPRLLRSWADDPDMDALEHKNRLIGLWIRDRAELLALRASEPKHCEEEGTA